MAFRHSSTSFLVTIIILYSGKISLVHIFAIWLQSPQQKCSWVLIFAFQCQETTPTNNLHVKIPVRGSLSRLLFSCYCMHACMHALSSKNTKKCCTPRKFPAIRCMVCRAVKLGGGRQLPPHAL